MSDAYLCPECTQIIPESADRCPHCARPGTFPNVRAAMQAKDVAALDRRLKKARKVADSSGTRGLLDELEGKASGSRAVICKHIGEVQRLASSDKQGIASYYQLIEAEARLPDGDEWDWLRRHADMALFPGYGEHIRFGALSPDGTGVRNYGPCSLTLRTDYIAHRATLFEENSAVFVKEIKVSKLRDSLIGYRAAWADRGKLAAAKLGQHLTPGTTSADLPGLLLRQGKTSADDDFVEVHVYGPLTIRPVEHVKIEPRPGERRPAPADIATLRDQLARSGVTLDVTP